MTAKLTALYYPHIAIDNEGLLKNALLLWDNVELICPFGDFPSLPMAHQQADAFKMIARPLQPSDEEKRAAHEAIIEIANSDLPDWFFPERVNKELRYLIYPEKLFPETWQALQETKLARPVMADVDPPIPRSMLRELYEQAERAAYETTHAFGLTILSIMADCCAGDTKQLVTDEVDSYVALDRYLKLVGGAKPEKKRKTDYERLVTLSLNVLDVSDVNLAALVSVRDSEKKRPELRAMRHAYVRKLDGYIERLRKEARNARDVTEIERTFQQEIADDVKLLKDELKAEGKKVIFSKEFGAAAVALGGTFVEPLTGSLVAAGALYKAKVEYRAARNKTLEKHAMSWLYEMRRIRAVKPKSFWDRFK